MTDATSPSPAPDSIRVPLARGFKEWFFRGLFYLLLFLIFRTFFGPPFSLPFQRRILRWLGVTAPAAPGATRTPGQLGGVPVDIVRPAQITNPAVLLYIHGGAFMVGSPDSHRALTTRLAIETGSVVYSVDYRLAPEHPYPAGLDDCLACYRALLDQGVPHERIVIAGDSAGGTLTLGVALRARELGWPQPAGLMPLSPATNMGTTTGSHWQYRFSDPMLRRGWMYQAIAAYAMPPSDARLLGTQADLTGLAPMYIQVGEWESLYDDSVDLAEHARRCGVPATLDVQEGLWHVYQLQARELASARAAIARLARQFTRWTMPDAPQGT